MRLLLMMVAASRREWHHRRVGISVWIGESLRDHVEALLAHAGRRGREVPAVATAVAADAAGLRPNPAISATATAAVVAATAATSGASTSSSSSMMAVAGAAAVHCVAVTAAAVFAGGDGAMNGRWRRRG